MTKPIETTVDEQNIVHICINGDLLEDKIDMLASCLVESEKVIADEFTKQGKKVKVLVDIENFNAEYAIKSFTHMIDFAIKTKPYVEKSAVFGSLEKSKMAAEMVIALARRDDIKVFGTQKEALEWLS